MKYGCIGEVLGHSFSKEIHAKIADYEYELCEVKRDDFDRFMKERSFSGINVTIPYKSAVIPYLYEIDASAKSIGAVNTVLNKDGKLYGYNTDYYGMRFLIEHLGLKLSDRKVVILGTGGTSKTALAVATNIGASEVLRVSRDGKEGCITYAELYEYHNDADIIINTTPCGMYPHGDECPVDLSKFPRLWGVIDAIYNPLRTVIVTEALKRGLKAEGGLFMLVAQAVRAAEIFLGTYFSDEFTEEIYKKMLTSKENIVLTGMPGSGKTTIGKILSEKLSREFIDTDLLIEKETGLTPSEIFAKYGEAEFRRVEAKIIKDISPKTSAIIATGGGAILSGENIDALKQNGRIFFIDRPLCNLMPTDDRPLARDREAIEKRYNERYEIYCGTCDVKIANETDAVTAANKIIEEFEK